MSHHEKLRPFPLEEEEEPIFYLFRHRFPWLILGLLGGMLISIIISKYETILSQDVRLAFFIPIIVYMSDAVGTQTETIYVRGLVKKETKFSTYLFKETILGLILGTVFGILLAIFATLWLGSLAIGLTVGLAMCLSVTIAPVLAILIPTLLTAERYDPAFGAGPFATIIQDFISLMIYFLVATIIIW